MEIIVLLKLSIAGFTSFVYFDNTFKSENKNILLAASVSYALCSFCIGYYFHIMWLDTVLILPIVLLGIDRILDDKSSIIYGLSLFYGITTNYYMGYMLCIFSCLYFIYQILIRYNLKSDKEKIFKYILKFGITSLLSEC